MPIVNKEKVAIFLSKLNAHSETESEEAKRGIIQKIEDKFGICLIGNETENAKNFFISNHKTAALYYKL